MEDDSCQTSSDTYFEQATPLAPLTTSLIAPVIDTSIQAKCLLECVMDYCSLEHAERTPSVVKDAVPHSNHSEMAFKDRHNFGRNAIDKAYHQLMLLQGFKTLSRLLADVRTRDHRVSYHAR